MELRAKQGSPELSRRRQVPDSVLEMAPLLRKQVDGSTRLSSLPLFSDSNEKTDQNSVLPDRKGLGRTGYAPRVSQKAKIIRAVTLKYDLI